MREWGLFTPHMRALLYIAEHPGIRIRDVAVHLELTERAAHRIVGELVEERYLTRHKLGARNFYEVHPERPLRHAAEGEATVGDVLGPLLHRQTPADGSAGALR